MFQSFTGSSRRPRQVNLSGQHVDPFAAGGWGAPVASGTQKTVAAAQQERQHRQQERERLHATKRIQRTWRGHRTRRELASVRRHEWDILERYSTDEPNQYSAHLIEQLRLLLSFFNSHSTEDVGRLERLSKRLLVVNQPDFWSQEVFRSKLLRLAKVSLVVLDM
jgi:ubiquitin-protein ligase E3 C